VINNITDFRMLSKIATSIDNVGVREAKAARAIRDILDPSKGVGIADVYAEQFEMRYDERKVQLNLDSVYEYLYWSLENDSVEFGAALASRLEKLRDLINTILAAQNEL